jgi:hypothetical protein
MKKFSKKEIEFLEKGSYKLDLAKPPPKPQNTFYVDSKIVGSLGNFIVISGLPKVRKSTINSMILASIFGYNDIGFRFNYPLNREKNILYFDTEQNAHSTYKLYERACMLAEGTIQDVHIYTLRTADAVVIINTIEFEVQKYKPAIIFIDGLLDLCDNFNSEVESKILINYLKRITTEYNLLCITVIHLSKSSGQTLGHLGAMADRYAQSTIEIFKDKDRKQDIGVRAKLMRDDLDFDEFYIHMNPDGSYNKL